MRKVTVHVTQEDIERGEPYDPEGCMLALAMRRAIPGAIVGKDWFTLPGFVGALPTEACAARQRFDRGGQLAGILPFSFEVEVP